MSNSKSAMVLTGWVGTVGEIKPKVFALTYFVLIPIFGGIFASTPYFILDCGKHVCGPFQAFYLSVITITTLGYGDVIPLNAPAQLTAAIEALLGIVTIGLFLNSLSFAISQAAQRAEARASERLQASIALAKLRSFDSIVRIYADRLRVYAFLLVTPMSDRNNSDPTKKGTNFTFRDMRDLFKPTLLLTDDFNTSTVRHYLNAQDDLQLAIREFMQGLDLSPMPVIARVTLLFFRTT